MNMQSVTTTTPTIMTSSMPSFFRYQDTYMGLEDLRPTRRKRAAAARRSMSATVMPSTKTAIIRKPMKALTSPSSIQMQSSFVASRTVTSALASLSMPICSTMGFTGWPRNSRGSGPSGWYCFSISTSSAITGVTTPRDRSVAKAASSVRQRRIRSLFPICLASALHQPSRRCRSLTLMPSDATVEPMQKRLKQVKPTSRSIRVWINGGWFRPRTR
mmetsp:Transcript_45993/g.135981  ORF Transcript_45993/g.135981 Transcript_45993/m.135981 type:complete len:216 (+) Transcript_45993:347-994(+)